MVDDRLRLDKSLERIDTALLSKENVDKILQEIDNDFRKISDTTAAKDYLVQLTQRIFDHGLFPKLTQAYLKANFENLDRDSDRRISVDELKVILTSKLLQSGTSAFEKQIIQYTLANFQAIANASDDQWGTQTLITGKDVDQLAQAFEERARKVKAAQTMLAQFGTPELFAKLKPTGNLVSEAQLKAALSNGAFSKGERETIQFMIDQRKEIANIHGDQRFFETKISLNDVQGYARIYSPTALPESMTKPENVIVSSNKGPVEAAAGKPSARDICRFVEENFGALDIDGNGYISKEEVDKLLKTPKWRDALSESDRKTLQAFSDLLQTMQKASRDEWWWYKDTRGVTLPDLRKFAEQDQYNNRDLPTKPGDHYIKMIIDGKEREVLVHIPPGYDGKKKVPQWVFLHSLFSDNREMPEWTSMTKKADQVGAIVVYPNARGWLPEWSPLHLREWQLHNKPSNKTDDLNFVKTIMDVTQKQLAIDAGQVYVIGYSNGGMLAHEVAARMPDRIAAVAVVGSTQCGDLPRPKGSLSVVTFNGTEDPLIPYEGRHWQAKLGFSDMKSVASTTNYWRDVTGATKAAPLVEPYAGIEKYTYTNPSNGQEVVHYKMNGIGHCWPGARSAMFGTLCSSMKVEDEIAAFFARHKKKVDTQK